MSNPQLHTEKDLLLLASKSDETAFTILFHTYKHKLYGYVFRLTDSNALTEDIIQDVFLKLWKDHPLLSEIENFGSYLFRMSKNHVVNHFKRMAHETIIVAEIFQQNPIADNHTQEQIAANDVKDLLDQIIEKLPGQQKKIYHLSREEGMSHDEIAHLLQISPNTVKNHMVQAMATIRSGLRAHGAALFAIALLMMLKK